MASSIDPNNPTSGQATTQSVRDNFQSAKDEIEALQAKDLSQDGLISQNASDIGTNASAISSNAAAITALQTGKADITYVDSENAAQDAVIAGNTTNISNNASAITALDGRVTQNESDIAALQGAGLTAWAKWNGTVTGTNPPDAGLNVASIQRVSAGLYQVNFATPMDNANYAATFSSNGFSVRIDSGFTPTVNAFRVQARNSQDTAADFSYCAVQISGG